jgi:type IV pilus assembly protein PilY1
MFLANNASETALYLRKVITSLLTKAGSDSGISVSNVNLKDGDNTAYVSSYNAQEWSGQLAAYPVDINTAQVDMSLEAQMWEARDQLTARVAANGHGDRLIVTYDGSGGIPFQPGSVIPAASKALLNTPSQSDADAVINWLRGDRSLEGTTYRARTNLLGDIVSAEPIFVAGALSIFADSGYNAFASSIETRQKMIYQAANDGMVHAFDATNGAERWAYVPRIAYPRLNALSDPMYTHQFNVDGTPTAADVDLGNTLSGTGEDWRTILVGGLGAGGPGYYALDVTDPNAGSEDEAAQKVLWEFPNASTPAGTVANIGYSFGKPVIAKTSEAGWVVLVTSGYNNTTPGDGKGHLFVLNARSGAVIADIVTSAGNGSDPSGLAQISAWANNAALDATVDFVYGGDLKGNLWRFDLRGAPASWSATKLATLTSADGTPQQISSAPELAQINGRRMVFVGTGALIGSSDIANAQGQSVYGIVDDPTAPPLSAPRTELKNKPVTVAGGGVRHIDSSQIDFTVYRGWYFDLPGPGERVNTSPSAAFGVLVFTTNQPSTTACSSQSFLYAVDLATGGELPSGAFGPGENTWSGKSLGQSLASRPVIVVLPNGGVQSITHKSDTSLSTQRLPVQLGGKVRKVGWKEIFR